MFRIRSHVALSHIESRFLAVSSGDGLAQLGTVFDVIVVGGGPAGLSAGLMLGRCRRRVLICDVGEPRNRQATALHGYLTRDGIAPSTFNDLGRRELPHYGVEFQCVGVTGAAADGDHYRVTLA